MSNANTNIKYLTKKAKKGWASYYRLLDESRKAVELLEKLQDDVPLQFLEQLKQQINGLRMHDKDYQKKKEEKKEIEAPEESVKEGSIICSPVVVAEEKKEEVVAPSKPKKQSKKKCVCGAEVIKMSRHEKTKTHKKFMEQVVVATAFEPTNIVMATAIE